MKNALFLRLLSQEEKAAMLAEAIAAVREGNSLNRVVYAVEPASFRQTPGAPFAYWVSERIRRLFTELPPFEGEGRTVKQGLATADDFRFVRAWWEVAPEKTLTGTVETTPEEFRRQTFEGKRWVPFAKGGAYSPYYADLHLVVNWERDGEEIRTFVDPITKRPYSRPQNTDFYFRPGLTWPLRARRFAPQALPAGSMCSVRGYGIFCDRSVLPNIAALGNSAVFDYLFKVLLGRFEFPEFIVGMLQQLPVPVGWSEQLGGFARIAYLYIAEKQDLDRANETSHVYLLPALLQVPGDTLPERIAAWQARVFEAERKLTAYQREIDEIAFRLYGIDEDDRRAMEEAVSDQRSAVSEEQDQDEAAEEKEGEAPEDARHLVADLLSYAVGCALGRWDVRFATGEWPAPQLPDPSDPLPVCSPGMLTGPDGLPLREAPPGYPLRFDPDGILVDDHGPDGNSPHHDDIVRRVREILDLLWGDLAEAIERETCQILGVKDLREYFRTPKGFFDDHIKRYSRSRRKAPMYWLLQSAKKSYGLWLSYHRLDKDTLFKALQHYVEPKIRGELARLRVLTTQLEAEKDTLPRRERTRLEKTIDRQQDLLTELTAFKEALQRVAALGCDPDLNDGVILNIAPLHQVVPWKEAKKSWDELCAGKYQWSTISRRLREKGFVRA